MIQINPNNLIRIELTAKEQKTVLQYCHSIDDDMHDRIHNAHNGIIHLLIEDCHFLKGCIHAGILTARKPKIKDILGAVFNKLSPNPTTRSIAEEIEGQDFDNIDDLNDHLQGMMTNRNTAPDPEMGGLSPEQVNRLIYLKWDDNNFPLKFNKELKLSDIKHSTFFTNATIFLKTLIEMEKEPTATAKGNLTRKVVKILFDKIIIDEAERNYILKYNKVINELDVRLLHHIRVACESTGIIELQKKKFLVKKKYFELLDDKNAGKLFYLLFFGYFTKFNIGYVDRSPDFNCIQGTIPYSFYRLSKIGKKQVKVNKLKKQLFLPAVLDEIRDGSEYRDDILDEITWLVESRIVKPLKLFGIVECSYKEKYKNYLVIDKVKKTKLFDKFVRIEW